MDWPAEDATLPSHERKLRRAKGLKELIKAADAGPQDDVCYVGQSTIRICKEEQYKISREM